jgi:hypothetical protein
VFTGPVPDPDDAHGGDIGGDPGNDMGGDLGGDPVCWLSRTCPECGAMPSESDDPDRCWRCGTALTGPPDDAARPPAAAPRREA